MLFSRIPSFNKQIAINSNLVGMYKLWEYLNNTQQVARGEFNISSKGFVASDGYIRALSFDVRWGLEIGVFKEAKAFSHLQTKIPTMSAEISKPKIKTLKMV